jgi:hypothetical protein
MSDNGPDTERSGSDDPVMQAFERLEAKSDEQLEILRALANDLLEQRERIRKLPCQTNGKGCDLCAPIS